MNQMNEIFFDKNSKRESNYFHTRNYIRNLSSRIPNRTSDLRFLHLAEILNYRKLQKLEKKRRVWDTLLEPIPVEYFESLGVKMNLLDFTLELDQEIYEETLEKEPIPGEFVLHIKSFVNLKH
ncbi:MAG: hypothetical protein KDK54_22310 [Leptospiraceae bacterium]|nr:hypothetical protein [Leptospiraceae bacterium]